MIMQVGSGNTGRGGDVDITAGETRGSSNGGAVAITTGRSLPTTCGQVLVKTTNAGVAGVDGAILLETSRTSAGPSGGLQANTGDAEGAMAEASCLRLERGMLEKVAALMEWLA